MPSPEQPPGPLRHGSETADASDFESHKEFVEAAQDKSCRHLCERLAAYALIGTSCAITALSVYSKLQAGDFLPITGFAPLMAFGGEALLSNIEKLESKTKHDR